MDLTQYKRLCIALLLPLIGVGWYLALSGRIIEPKTTIKCLDPVDRFFCIIAPKYDLAGNRNNFPLSFHGATIPAMNVDIISLSPEEMKANASLKSLIDADWPIQQPAIRERHLRATDEEFQEDNHADLSFYGDGAWMLTIHPYRAYRDGDMLPFRFAHATDEAKYLALHKAVLEARHEVATGELTRKLVVTAMPVAAFLLLSLAVFVVHRAVGYVRFGATHKTEGQ